MKAREMSDPVRKRGKAEIVFFIDLGGLRCVRKRQRKTPIGTVTVKILKRGVALL